MKIAIDYHDNKTHAVYWLLPLKHTYITTVRACNIIQQHFTLIVYTRARILNDNNKK